MLLYYAATYPNTITHYKASNIVLHEKSDAAYLTIPEARSCCASHFYLRNWPSLIQIKPNPERNGPIHTECKKIHHVVSSETQAETCGTFNNGKIAHDMQPDLITLDHKKPATPLKTENSTTEGFVNSGMKPKHSKAWHVKWHWLRDKEVLKQLRVQCYIETKNDSDYFTKNHPPIHHHQI